MPDILVWRCLRIKQAIRVGACGFHFLTACGRGEQGIQGDACQRNSNGPVAEAIRWLVCKEFQSKSLIMAQIERWRQALYMQVER